ncbi:MAG: hypothetical protein NZ874_06925 [Fimbriimonadales bacterium]|nr:hypothetical protein [Fimbriimonadales bacterium]
MEWAQWLALGAIGVAGVIFVPMWLIAIMHEILEHRREMKQGGARLEAITKQLQALREELHTLRDTFAEHHLSLQTQVESLQERVRALEEQGSVLPHSILPS